MTDRAVATLPGAGPRWSSLPDGSVAGTAVLTAAVWLATLALVVLAVRRARRGDVLGLGCLLGAFAVSWGEAFYDAVFHLAFYSQGTTLWSPFGIDQPLWVPAGYTAAYGAGAWLVADRLRRSGAPTVGGAARATAVAWIGCAVFETVAYHLGVLRYYDNALTLGGMPYWHEILNAVFIVAVGVVAATVVPLMADAAAPARVGVIAVLVVVAFPGVTYGAGFPALLAHNSGAGAALLGLGVVVSTVLACLVLWAVVVLARAATPTVEPVVETTAT